MNRKTATLVGAAAALAAGPSLAANVEVAPAIPVAASYADLLQPVPNAMERLQASDAQAKLGPAQLIDAQYYRNHHHHSHNRSWYLSNGYIWFGGRWILRPRNHHHHHHNHY